jgi:hypothetical protein
MADTIHESKPVKAILFVDGTTKSVTGRIAVVIARLLEMQDSINACNNSQIVVNSAGNEVKTKLQAEI